MPKKFASHSALLSDAPSAQTQPEPSNNFNGATSEPSERTGNGDNLLRDSLAYRIKRAQVRCDEALVHYLGPGLSPARFAALSTVGANPGISQTALGALLNIAGPSVVKVVDDLQKMDLVRRELTSNRRVHALQLTEKGATDLQRYQASVKMFENKIAEQLTPEERSQLIALLAKVAPEEA